MVQEEEVKVVSDGEVPVPVPVPEDDGSDDDDFLYEELDVESEVDADDNYSEDLDAIIRSLQTAKDEEQRGDKALEELGERVKAPGEVTRRPEVIDDFFRNFLVKMNLTRTLESFETEWYEMKATGRLEEENMGNVPDIYILNQQLQDVITTLRSELRSARAIAEKATSTWDKFRKERDFHRMHHKRVGQEKNKLLTDLKRLRKHYSQYEPTIKELRHKYEVAMKEKMLMRLERDRINSKLEGLEKRLEGQKLAGDRMQSKVGSSADSSGRTVPLDAKRASTKKAATLEKSKTAKGDTLKHSLPASDRENPYSKLEFEPLPVNSFSLQKTFKGHLMSVSDIAIHPKKPVIATASDDTTWKLWSIPNGDLIMAGEGHKDWVASVSFHPQGTQIATASGDSTVKLWDFQAARCTLTFTEHTQAVWGVAFHDTGDFLASCSLDHSTRLWDIATAKCKATLRGHVDSVNSVCWQPFTNNLCTGSSDKTVSLWDARTGLCAQTFYGHLNSCNSVVFDLKGGFVASCDADGIVKLWDVRMVKEFGSIDVGPHSANKVSLDRSGKVLAVACDDTMIKCFSLKGDSPTELCQLSGHEDSALSVAFDPYGSYAISSGADMTFRVWS
ncbi:WD40 repeat domain-containing protein [Chloropicon primus]|uniref:WD40 repeat domain-containing protein n=1 Tax=Chloropicon primus TaxID=1764295 RepID=A0A5B8MLW3_9CHLO|nr:WD40 repeat domain-containing protein [Chloropicon primus]UPQ99500.1 WD40 repeat domain-containing protein [Chloropicon primus]|eukprot:QDZ20290.1 WD40 repeat domain-containing protein [Chloropicon primus]